MRLLRWLNQIAIAVDQLLNALIGGWADETLSSAAYRMSMERKPWGFTRRVIDFIFRPLQADHCYKAYLAEMRRKQFPPGMRDR